MNAEAQRMRVIVSLVLNLYLKLPFGKMDRRNPDVIHLANIIGRTRLFGRICNPSAVSIRIFNPYIKI